MPNSGHEGHDMGKPEGIPAHPAPQIDAEHPGYEIQDVNVGGIITFLGGLAVFIVVFFVFCFFMGKVINTALVKLDGPKNRWSADLSEPGATPRGDKRENLASNAAVEQRQLAAMTQAFPTPRLETDDGNQDTADLHAREDLLLNYNSTSGDGTMRIPIDRAMELVVQRGLPAASTAASTPGTEALPPVQAPLTNGFARTGYELDTIEARTQKLHFETAEAKKK